VIEMAAKHEAGRSGDVLHSPHAACEILQKLSYFLSFFFPFSNTSFVYLIDKLGAVGTWIRHRLLVSILMGTPPLVAIQVKIPNVFQ